MNNAVVTSSVIKVSGSVGDAHDDLIAVEEPLEIRLTHGSSTARQQTSVAVTMRTPGNDTELAIGFLFSEGIIQSYDDVERCDVVDAATDQNIIAVTLRESARPSLTKLERNFYTTSSCGVCGKSSIDAIRAENIKPVHATVQVTVETILSLTAKINHRQTVFEHTGGLHAVSCFDFKGNFQFLREDVGRHNAFDKLMGKAIIDRISLEESIVLLSGRASFELVQKSAVAGVPLLVAVGAPSSLAIELARQFDITLIGFLRDNRFNIYHGEKRILMPA